MSDCTYKEYLLNIAADSISRNNLQVYFARTVPGASPLPVPQPLWQLLVVQMPDLD